MMVVWVSRWKLSNILDIFTIELIYVNEKLLIFHNSTEMEIFQTSTEMEVVR